MIPVTPELAAQLAAKKEAYQASRRSVAARLPQVVVCVLCRRPAAFDVATKDPKTGLERVVRVKSPLRALVQDVYVHEACVAEWKRRRAAGRQPEAAR